MKSLFQDGCKLKINWDSPWSEEYSRRSTDIISDISQSPPIVIKHAIFTDIDINDIVSIQLHGFGDTSNIAYLKCHSSVFSQIEKDMVWFHFNFLKSLSLLFLQQRACFTNIIFLLSNRYWTGVCLTDTGY